MIVKKSGHTYITDTPKDKKGLRCFLCGRVADHIHHIFYGRGKRNISDREKLTVALCYKCHWQIHNNHLRDRELKKLAQEVWLRNNDQNRAKWYRLFYKFYN